MKKQTIRIFSILCALAVLITFLPAAYSEEDEETVRDTPVLSEAPAPEEPSGEEPGPEQEIPASEAAEEEQPSSAEAEEEQPAPATAEEEQPDEAAGQEGEPAPAAEAEDEPAGEEQPAEAGEPEEEQPAEVPQEVTEEAGAEAEGEAGETETAAEEEAEPEEAGAETGEEAETEAEKAETEAEEAETVNEETEAEAGETETEPEETKAEIEEAGTTIEEEAETEENKAEEAETEETEAEVTEAEETETEEEAEPEEEGEPEADADQIMLDLGYVQVMVIRQNGTNLYEETSPDAEAVGRLEHGDVAWIRAAGDIWGEVYQEEDSKPLYLNLNNVVLLQGEVEYSIPIRKVRLVSTLDGLAEVEEGTEITITAEFSGFPEDEIADITWLYRAEDDSDGSFREIEGAHGFVYTYTVSPENIHNEWRIVLTLKS